jgi:hypothetical protein
MYYAWAKSGVTGSCLAMSCSVSGTSPTGCRPCTAHGLNQVFQVPVWLCYVVLVGHVPQVADHALRMG